MLLKIDTNKCLNIVSDILHLKMLDFYCHGGRPTKALSSTSSNGCEYASWSWMIKAKGYKESPFLGQCSILIL